MTRPDKPVSIALDTCTVLSSINAEPFAVVVDRVVEAARAGTLELFASTMLLVEALGQGTKAGPHDPALEALVLERLLQPHWTYVELDRRVALKARDLIATHRLRNADAVHLASAIVAEAEVFMTLDTGFPLDTNVDGTWVCKPYPPHGPDLYTELD